MRFKYAPSSGPIQLAKSIAALNSNVVILSETGDEMTNTLRAAMSVQYDTWSSVNDADNGILSRFPIIESSKGNSYVKAVIDTGYSKVAVYSAHLDWHNYAPYLPRGYGGGALSGVTSEYGWNKIPTGPITDTKIIGAVNRNSDRYSEMNAIINDAKTESQKGREIIIGGDFNASPYSAEMLAFKKYFNCLNEENEYTFPSENPKKTIDYLFAYNKTDYTFIKSGTTVMDEKIASDHCPLYVDVTFLK